MTDPVNLGECYHCDDDLEDDDRKEWYKSHLDGWVLICGRCANGPDGDPDYDAVTLDEICEAAYKLK